MMDLSWGSKYNFLMIFMTSMIKINVNVMYVFVKCNIFKIMTRKSTASSWLWSGNKYYYIIYYDNRPIWQNADIFLNEK